MAAAFKPKKKGLFGNALQDAPQPDAMGLRAPMKAPEEKRPGLGTRLLGPDWGDKVFALGGLIAGDGGRAVQGYHAQQKQAAMMEQQQQQQMQADAAKRENAYQDFIRKEQWKLDNAQPANNDTANDYEFWKERLEPQQFEQWLTNNHINPSFYTGPDGRRYPNPTANRPSVGTVVADPRKRGGPVQKAPGGF